MKKEELLLFMFCFFAASVFAQVKLPNTGDSVKPPADSDRIQVVRQPVGGSQRKMNARGFHPGDHVADFTLYDTASKAVTLSHVLNDGKPVLIISGSLTCPVFRDGIIHTLPSTFQNFSRQVNIIIIYTIEAHPAAPDHSPYVDKVWVPHADSAAKILYRQPQNYYQRKIMARRLLKMFPNTRGCKVLLDSPENGWWKIYGESPSVAYLIDPSGKVFRRYDTFNIPPSIVQRDISTLLTGKPANSGQKH